MKRRHVLAVLGLSFVTIGIYVIYWLYKTRMELLAYLPDKKAIPRVLILFTPFFALVGVIIFMGILAAALVNDPYSTTANALNVVSIILFCAVILAGLVVSFWWFYRYFKAVEAVTQGNDAMLLYTLWIILTIMGLGPIWILIVQNDLNKFIDNGYRPLKGPGYHGAPQQPWQPPAPQPYGQPYAPQPPYPPHPYPQQNAAPPPPYQQSYPPYPGQATPEQPRQPAYGGPHHATAEHDQHHESHTHHQQPDHHGHHGHPDQPHDGQNHHQPPQN